MKRRRLQPGDIAISVNTDLPESDGLIVEILAVGAVDPSWGEHQRPLCFVRSAGARPIHLNLRVDGKWHRSIVCESAAPESRFRPITPPEKSPADQKDLELLAD